LTLIGESPTIGSVPKFEPSLVIDDISDGWDGDTMIGEGHEWERDGAKVRVERVLGDAIDQSRDTAKLSEWARFELNRHV